MQVEFYVSDIQEVRNRFSLWSQLWHHLSQADTWRQPGHITHRDLLPQSISLSVSHLILTLISLFLTYNHPDTCLTPNSLVAETHWCSAYSPLRVICHTLVLFSFTLNLGLVWLIHIFKDYSALSRKEWRWLWNISTQVFPPSGGQRHSKHPDWRRER